MKKVCRHIGTIISAILPIASLLYFTGIYDFYLYNWLWCGLYGCIMVYIFSKAKIYKYMVPSKWWQSTNKGLLMGQGNVLPHALLLGY